MRVLLAEDHAQYSGFFVQELRERYGHEVTHVSDPILAEEQAASGEFRIAIIDLLFDSTVADFEKSSLSRNNPLTSGRLIVSGLSIIRAAIAKSVGIVVWTSGEPNRRLHLVFAYEDLAVRAFCSKGSAGGAQSLNDAVVKAAAGQESIDVAINSFLPPERAIPLRQTVLRDPASQRSIWRALALGARSRGDVSSITGLEPRTVGNLVLDMYDDLKSLDVGLQTGRSRLASRARFNELTIFASRNREFFLDDAVREMYP